MIKDIISSYLKPMITVLGYCLPILGTIVVCYASFFSKMPIPIEKPVILAVASFFVLVPFGSESSSTLQKIMLFYLVCVPVNELSAKYFQISFLSVNIHVSYSIVILLPYVAGYLLERINLNSIPQSAKRTDIQYSWVMTLVIVIIHMLLLTLILSKFYGYGYERNLSVLGNLCLYFLLFIVLWEKLDKVRFRQGIGLVLNIFYLAAIIVKR